VSGERVLVVDDEPQFLRALETNLRGAGYEVETAATAQEALAAAGLRPPDAVILDLLLPDGTGTEVCRELRTWSEAPIVLVSAVGDEAEKIAALDAGADDYVTKPFDVNELVARLRAVTRRTEPGDGEPLIRLGQVAINLEAKTVERTGPDGTVERVTLTPTEWNLLEMLVSHPGRLVSQSALLARLRGQEGYTDSSYLRIYIAQLRRKLEPEPSRPRHFLTEPGMGYRFQA
jgi:two-component system KDP operon response regulator KdpE